MHALGVSTTINANIQNEINTSIIFRYLCANTHVYRARIAQDLGISAPAVSRVIDRLVEGGFVVESGKIMTGKGKKAAELCVNTGRGIVIGIDLIKSPTRIAISDFRGTIISKRPGFAFTDSTDALAELSAEIDQILDIHATGRTLEKPAGNLKAICVGVPSATTDAAHPRIIASLYRSLEGLDLGESLGRRYRVPVYIENVVKLSALAEANFGAALTYRDVAFVEISNGIGAGIIVDNHLLTGANGASGELGFALIGAESLPYVARNKGFLEKHASLEGIAQRATEAARESDGTVLRRLAGGELEHIDAGMVCEAALQGDPTARQVIDQASEFLSIGIINLILMLDPQIVVIGGDVCRMPGMHELFIDPIRRNVANIVPFQAPPLAVSTLGEDAGIIGASYLAIESLLTRDFPYKLYRAPPAPTPSGP
jgi:predicted NBD/HSP70 family sugar kinase